MRQHHGSIYSLECTCDHLTEFSAFLRRLRNDERKDSCSASRFGGAGLSASEQKAYAFWGSMYILVWLSVILQLCRLGWATQVLGQRFFSLGGPNSQHILLFFVSWGRWLSCFWYAGEYELSLFFAALVSSLPYLLTYWIFSLLIFQWHVLLYQPMKRAADAFASVRPLFLGLNIIAAITIVTLFSMIAADPESDEAFDTAVAGSVIMMLVTLITGLAFVHYGRKVADMISETQSQVSGSRRDAPSGSRSQTEANSDGVWWQRLCCLSGTADVASRMRRASLVVAIAFVMQAVLWAASAGMLADDASPADHTAVTSLFLLFDLLALVAVLALYSRFVSKLTMDASGKSAGESSAPSHARSAVTAAPNNRSDREPEIEAADDEEDVEDLDLEAGVAPAATEDNPRKMKKAKKSKKMKKKAAKQQPDQIELGDAAVAENAD